VAGKLFVLLPVGLRGDRFHHHHHPLIADSTAHILENPLVQAHFSRIQWLDPRVSGTMGAVFLRAMEAIGLAVCLVISPLFNLVVIMSAPPIWERPLPADRVANALWAGHNSSWLMVAMALWLFPKLAPGLSGFETGVTVSRRGDQR
jgi:hypothetical protein